MIPKPLEGLTYAPPFSKFHKHESNGVANPLIGMQANLTCEIPSVADRQPLEQLAAARFRFLACLHPLPKDLQFDNAERPFDSQHQLVIKVIQIVDLLLVGDPKSRSHHTQTLTQPILASLLPPPVAVPRASLLTPARLHGHNRLPTRGSLQTAVSDAPRSTEPTCTLTVFGAHPIQH